MYLNISRTLFIGTKIFMEHLQEQKLCTTQMPACVEGSHRRWHTPTAEHCAAMKRARWTCYREEVHLKGWVEKASFKRRDSMAHFKVQTCECTYKYTYETGASKKPGASHLKWRWEGWQGLFAFYSTYVGTVGIFNKIAWISLKTGKAVRSKSCP